MATAPHTTPGLNVDLLVTLRKNAGLTRPQLARLAGIDPSQLWRIEHGESRPYDSTLAALARVLGVTVAVLRAPAA